MQEIVEGSMDDVFVDFLREGFDLNSPLSEHLTACVDIPKSIHQNAVGNLRSRPIASQQHVHVAQSAAPASNESQLTDGKNKERNRFHQRNYQQRRRVSRSTPRQPSNCRLKNAVVLAVLQFY